MMEYLHGGDIYTNRVELDYSANLNPFGPPEGVKRAYLSAVSGISAYPDSRCARLCGALSRFHGIGAGAVICANGAAELIYLIVRAVKPKRAVVLAPSFLEYRHALLAEGCEVSEFMLEEGTGFSFSVPAFLAALRKETGAGRGPSLVFLSNPNNPTGLAAARSELLPLVRYCEEQEILLVADECFIEFMEEPERFSLMKELRSGGLKQLFLLKAFTKVYAMAGLRLGYGLSANGELLEELERFRQPWSVSGPAQAAGEAALLETDYVMRTREFIIGERERLRLGLAGLGFYVYPSAANYLFFRDDFPEAGGLYRRCLKKGLLIRFCQNYEGLNGRYYRICVGSRENNGRFLEIMEKVCRERSYRR